MTATLVRQLKIDRQRLSTTSASSVQRDPSCRRSSSTASPSGSSVGRKKKPVTAISDVSLRLERGDIHGILGANGSGKSTLIRLICGLLTLDEGRVEVFGHDIDTRRDGGQAADQPGQRRRRLLQEAQPDGEPPLRGPPVRPRRPTTAKREAVAILARLGISEKRVGRPIEQMSRGMQQKVAIARALLTSPTLLLLDEPTTGLDPRSKLDVQAFIEELRETHDATIVLTTHDLAEAERLCGRITILNDGRVVAEDTPDGLKAIEPRPRAGPATARRRVHDLHRPLPRRRRRRGRSRRRIRLKGGDSNGDTDPVSAGSVPGATTRASASSTPRHERRLVARLPRRSVRQCRRRSHHPRSARALAGGRPTGAGPVPLRAGPAPPTGDPP